MSTISYQVRKRLFRGDSPLTIMYRCRRCGHSHILPITEVVKEDYIFTCKAGHCKLQWGAPRYNIVWRVLAANGCHPVAYPAKLRFNRLNNYISYHTN